jgi:hypothetical protein
MKDMTPQKFHQTKKKKQNKTKVNDDGNESMNINLKKNNTKQ